MTLDCEKLQALVKGFSLVHQCDVIRNGMLRMATTFQYPNGSSIDLFLNTKKNGFNELILTDLGQTTAYLLDLHIKPWTTKKRKQIVSDICEELGVEQNGGEYQIIIVKDKLDDLAQAIVRLAQTCIRLSDLALTQRFRSVTVFRDELEEFVESTSLRYETSVVLPGRFGKDVEVDFQITGRQMKSLIQTLSTANAAAAHSLGNEVFRRWYDLLPQTSHYQFLTVYDTNNNIFRDDDLARLASLSTVFGFPANQDELTMTLGA